MRRRSLRLTLNRQRLWIPGSAARPRDDAEDVGSSGEIDRLSFVRSKSIMPHHALTAPTGAFAADPLPPDAVRFCHRFSGTIRITVANTHQAGRTS